VGSKERHSKVVHIEAEYYVPLCVSPRPSLLIYNKAWVMSIEISQDEYFNRIYKLIKCKKITYFT
jgi:hypothetical protein